MMNQIENQVLSQKNTNLFFDTQKIFEKYKKLLNDHQEVLKNYEDIIVHYKNQSLEDFIKILKQKEVEITKYQKLPIYIQYKQNYQNEINQINDSVKEIHKSGDELLISIKTLNEEQQNNQEQQSLEAQNQLRNQKINSINQQIKNMLELKQNLINTLNSFQQISKDDNLNIQIQQQLSYIQLCSLLFDRVQNILPRQLGLIKKYEEKQQQFKEQLRKEQKTKENYEKKMLEYKDGYDKLLKSKREGQNIQQEIQPSQQNKSLNHCYTIYLHYLTLILNLVKIKDPQQQSKFEKDIEKCKPQLSEFKEFKDFKQLIKIAEGLSANFMVLANYIEDDNNKILDLFISWQKFSTTFMDLLKEMSE